MRSVQNHQRNTNIVRLALILSILITSWWLFSYAVPKDRDNFTFENKLNSEMSNRLETNKKPDYEISIESSIFEGMDKDSNPYKVIAGSAIKISDEQYKLERITAQHLINNDWIAVSANKGNINDRTKLLTLKEQVRIIFGEVILNSEQLQVNLADKTITGSSSVSLKYNNSKIVASRFISSENNNIIKFQGNVITKISRFDF